MYGGQAKARFTRPSSKFVKYSVVTLPPRWSSRRMLRIEVDGGLFSDRIAKHVAY